MSDTGPLHEKFGGEFVPSDLSIRFSASSEVWKRSFKDNLALASVFRHEFHHYNTTVGTTWGMMYLRYYRSWTNLALKLLHEHVRPIFERRAQKIPYPLERFCNPQAGQFDEELSHAIQPFWKYRSGIEFDLGVIDELPVHEGKSASLPSVQI